MCACLICQVLLNGVAISFVLVIDDELPVVLLSDSDKKAGVAPMPANERPVLA